jgi:hypothetical protein
MITNTGKYIIAKYLLGQTPAYASYMALGCGAKPLDTSEAGGDYSQKENLDFEMFRVPISSRGYVVEDGQSKLVLTAELPTEERYEISEIGIYSAGSNPNASSYDSRSILVFSQGENWQHVTTSATTDILRITEPLDSALSNNVIDTNSKIFESNADNKIFYNSNRANRYERCRYFNNIIAVRGDSSVMTTSGGHLVVGSDPEYIRATGISLDFSKNAPSDELRLAFSVINKDGDSLSVPDTVKILLEFTNSIDSSKFTRFEVSVANGTGAGQHDFVNNRYCVINKELQELYTTSNFSWSSVDTVNIYASVVDSGSESNNFYVVLDALRFENLNTPNPLYGLIGYSIIQNDTAKTVIKSTNTSNYVEFKFAIGVG